MMKTDVAIVGGGPGGAATGIFLAQRGISSVIVEKESFPRFHIGESMTGECGNVVRKLGLEHEMTQQRHPIKYGTAVMAPNGLSSFYVPVQARTPSGDLKDGTTWQVRRSVFDNMLLEHAATSGCQYVPGEALAPVVAGDGAVRGIKVRLDSGREEDVKASIVVDASGQNTFLASTGVAGPKERGRYNRQVAVFSHFTGAIRGEGLRASAAVSEDHADDTVIFYQRLNHWAWFIPLDDEVVSIGVVVPSEYLRERRRPLDQFLLEEMRTLNPALAAKTADAVMVEQVRTRSNYSYHVQQFVGDGWLCVGDSHRFIDPIFSFGLSVALHEASMGAAAIERSLQSGGSLDPLLAYQQRAEGGLDVLQLMLDGFWTNPLAFGYRVHRTHRDDFIDMFAGRIYGEIDTPGHKILQRLSRQRVDTTKVAV